MSRRWGRLLTALLLGLLLILPSGPARASGPPPAGPVAPDGPGGQLQVTVTDLPPNVPAAVTVTGSAALPAGEHVVGTRTLSLPASRYTISAQPVAVGTSTYYPTVSPATVTVQAGTAAQVTVDYLTIVPNTTRVLGSAALGALVSAGPGFATLVFRQSPGLPALAPGDILVAGVSPRTPDGFLRKVTAVRGQGTQLMVTTGPATLLEAVTRGAFAVQATLPVAGSPGEGAPILQTIQRKISCDSGATMELTGFLSVVPSVKRPSEVP